ncbi:TlpA family protein disulfide reductase [Gaetbulibacter aestuarii]|uniref:TlpA disulfide reductase family protein n=1 Tax=Gaetbulibacter aestuarii TaxID=1502358 RepID=A0ABW7MVR0_9FLAO
MLNKFIVYVLLLPGMLLAQHTIKGTFTPPKDYKVVLLYKVTPSLSNYITNTKVDKDGHFQFSLDSTATTGIYRIVYAVPQEDYNFDVIYNGKEDIELAFNAETGVEFLKSKENKLLTSYTNSMSLVTQSISNYYREQRQDTTAIMSIFKTQRETQAQYEKAAEGMIALHFIKANKPYIPKKYQNVSTYVNNLKTHYYDHVDFKDRILQSSSFLEERMLNYVFGMRADGLDEVLNYEKNIDKFCAAMKDDLPIKAKRILLVDLWEQFKDLGQDKVANYIAETYLMDIAVKLNDQQLIHDLLMLINTGIGEIAPDFPIEMTQNGKTVIKKLSELKGAEEYVVLFWSSTCSHCLYEVPKFYKYIETKPNVKVVAVGLEDGRDNWEKVKQKFPDFIHVYGAGHWDNEIGNNYGVTATPTYFILDKDKHIINKPKTLDELEEFLDTQGQVSE